MQTLHLHWRGRGQGLTVHGQGCRAGYKSPFLPLQQKREGVDHTTPRCQHKHKLSCTKLTLAQGQQWGFPGKLHQPWKTLDPFPGSACHLPPNFQTILTCSPAPDLSQCFHTSTIPGFLTRSHLSPPTPADPPVPIPLARTPGSLPAPRGHQQECKGEIGTDFVFPERWLERWEGPFHPHPRHRDSRTRAGLLLMGKVHEKTGRLGSSLCGGLQGEPTGLSLASFPWLHPSPQPRGKEGL